MTVGFIIFVFDLLTGRSGVSPRSYWAVIVILAVGAVALASIVLGGRSRWAYYIGSCSLGIWSIRAVYTLSWYAYRHLSGQGTPTTPYFHLAERDKPFMVPRHVSSGRELLIAILVGLMVWLFIRFTFGRPSRSYYGFPNEHSIEAKCEGMEPGPKVVVPENSNVPTIPAKRPETPLAGD